MTEFGEVVDFETLATGEEVGQGGQATVYRLTSAPGYLFKRYSGLAADPAALDRLVQWRRSLGPVDREILDVRTCWPRARVVAGGETLGVIIPEAPEEFFVEVGGSRTRKLNEIQYLTHADRAMKLGLVIPEPTIRAKLVADFASLLELFDNHAVVHGDVSFKNLLWTVDPIPLVYLLDCDGARLGPHPAAVPQVTTQHWTDPRLQRGEIRHPDLDSDRLALGLVFYRAFYSARGDFSGGQIDLALPANPPLPSDIRRVAERSLTNSANRPAPVEWRFLSQVKVDAALIPPHVAPTAEILRPEPYVDTGQRRPVAQVVPQQPVAPAAAFAAAPLATVAAPSSTQATAAAVASSSGFTVGWIATLFLLFIISSAVGWALVNALA